MNMMNRAKSTARIERFSQLAPSASLLVGVMLAFAVTVFPAAVQARNDNDNDRDDHPAYGYHRYYDPDARYPDGSYPRGDWDRYRGDSSSGYYGRDNPNAHFYEPPYARGSRDHDRDRDRDGDNDNDQYNNHHNHSHHHHHGWV